MNANPENKGIMINALDVLIITIRSSAVLIARRRRRMMSKVIYHLYQLLPAYHQEKTMIQPPKAVITQNQTPKVILLLIVVVVAVSIIRIPGVVVLEKEKKIIKSLNAWKRNLCLRKETELDEDYYIVNKKLNDGNEKTFWFNLFIILKQYLINSEIDFVDIIFLS